MKKAFRLFGTSGIRGDIRTKVTPDLVLKFGASLATYLGNKGEVVVGRDARTSSKMIEAGVVSGLIYGGCNVVLLGLVPTPLLAFQTRIRKMHAGIMITASHNPPTDNGLKCFDSEGMEYSPDAEGALEKAIMTRKWRGVSWDRLGKVTKCNDAKEQYIQAIVRRVAPIKREIKAVVDCANGATHDIAPVLMKELGCRVFSINAHPDGFFPRRGLEPSPECLQALSGIVKRTSADIGIAFDGDGDRLAIVDNEGRVVSNDRVIALFALTALERCKGGLITTSVDTSFCIEEVVKKNGGVVERTRLGKTFIGLKRRGRAVLAAEPWKIIDPSWGFWSDGIYSSARIVKMMDERDEAVTQLFAKIPSYPKYIKSFFCPDRKKTKVMELIEKEAPREVETATVWTYDGIRVNFIDGSWLLFRASGTEPKVRLYVEGKNVRRLEELVRRGETILKRALA